MSYCRDCTDSERKLAALTEAAMGLLTLAEKMFDLLKESARRGDATLKPDGVTFEKLRFVKLTREALSAHAQPAPEQPATESTKRGRAKSLSTPRGEL